METAAFIIIMASALVAAAAGLGLAWGYNRYRVLPYPLYWFAVGGGAAGALIAAMVITGQPFGLIRSVDRVPLDQVTPYMHVLARHKDLKDAEGALYERITTLIVRDREEGRGEDEVRSNAISQTLSFAADKIPQMPDEIVYAYYSFTRDELAHLGKTQEFNVCGEVALGRIPGDIESKLSDELIDRQRGVITRIIDTPADPNATRLGQEPFGIMASRAFASASEATGIAPNEIETLLAGTGDTQKVCRLMKAFFDAMLAHPVDAASPALRALAAGERGS